MMDSIFNDLLKNNGFFTFLFIVFQNFVLSYQQDASHFNVVLATTRKPFFVPSQRNGVMATNSVSEYDVTMVGNDDVIYDFSDEDFQSVYDETNDGIYEEFEPGKNDNEQVSRNIKKNSIRSCIIKVHLGETNFC